MSADNSITPMGTDVDASATRASFEIPPELANRYQVRVVETPGSGDRRLGMFLSGDRSNPALEIANDRIVAREGDPETIVALVTLAKHNGWDRIDVEGSPAFRKAMWTAGTKEGLTVQGYEPSFAEAEQIEALRRADAERGEREAAKARGSATGDRAANAAERTEAVVEAVAHVGAESAGTPRPLEASPATERRSPATGSAGIGDSLERDERAMFERIFARGIRALEASGDPRALAVREAASAVVDQIYGEREDRAVAQSTREQDRQPEPGVPTTKPDGPRDADADRHRGSDELADLFLHGAVETLQEDPRLAKALAAQRAMELHIAEVFHGDASQMATANLTSRHMISDVLRRGLDVSVREPTPVRQIEPIQTPEYER